MQIKRLATRLTTIVLILCLCSCANRPIFSSNKHKTVKPSAITRFTVDGAVGLNNQGRSSSGSFYWQVSGPNHYRARIFSPLSGDSAELTVKQNRARLRTSDGNEWQANSVTKLLADQTQWALPVDALYYWIRGLPAPGPVKAVRHYEDGSVREIEQRGWLVRISRYKSRANSTLPHKFLLQNRGVTIRLVISHWKV